jgi:2-dehydropantoate 2-reductase
VIICAQNGLESERVALRFFPNVFGAYVYVFAASLEPGVVSSHSQPTYGVLDVGRFPGGADPRAEAIAADFRAARFASIARDDIVRWKRGKLVINAANGIDAACGDSSQLDDLVAAAREEAEACFRAEGADYATPEEIFARAKQEVRHALVDGEPFPGGSTFQSLARGATATEGDYLHGEIVLRGRMLGIPTPVAAGQQQVLRELARSGGPARSIPSEVLRRRLSTPDNP